MKDIEREASEKSEKLSHYLDDELSKVSQSQGKKYEKMKIIFTKLAE